MRPLLLFPFLLPLVPAPGLEYLARSYVENGVEVPYTLRGVISCTIPGLNLLWCQGPRVQAMKTSETVYGRPQFRNGLHNGVDLRFLKLAGLQRKTEVGRSLGAGFAIDDNDGEVEFGDRFDIADVWTQNKGGGVDIGWRGAAADNLLRIHSTTFGVEYGDDSRPPFRRDFAKGAGLKGWTAEGLYPGYRHRDDWYKHSFRRMGDEYRTPSKRACPWCFAVDGVL